MNSIPVTRNPVPTYLLGWCCENLYKEVNVKERKAEDEILSEKEEDANHRHLKIFISLLSSLPPLCSYYTLRYISNELTSLRHTLDTTEID